MSTCFIRIGFYLFIFFTEVLLLSWAADPRGFRPFFNVLDVFAGFLRVFRFSPPCLYTCVCV